MPRFTRRKKTRFSRSPGPRIRGGRATVTSRPRRPEGNSLGLGLALAVPLLGSERIGLHVGTVRGRWPHRRQRAGQHQPPHPRPEHRVTHGASALGVHPEEGRALGGAPQPREVEDDIDSLDGRNQGPRVGHVSRHPLHAGPVEPRCVAPGTHQGPDPMPVPHQPPAEGAAQEPVCSGDQGLHVRGASQDFQRGERAPRVFSPLKPDIRPALASSNRSHRLDDEPYNIP